jgi:hypothetical protein
MPKRSYKGDKRRRELAKKRKRDDKLIRKSAVKEDGESSGEDNSYLEYLHPGGLPEELQEDSESESDEEESADN